MRHITERERGRCDLGWVALAGWAAAAGAAATGAAVLMTPPAAWAATAVAAGTPGASEAARAGEAAPTAAETRAGGEAAVRDESPPPTPPSLSRPGWVCWRGLIPPGPPAAGGRREVSPQAALRAWVELLSGGASLPADGWQDGAAPLAVRCLWPGARRLDKTRRQPSSPLHIATVVGEGAAAAQPGGCDRVWVSAWLPARQGWATLGHIGWLPEQARELLGVAGPGSFSGHGAQMGLAVWPDGARRWTAEVNWAPPAARRAGVEGPGVGLPTPHEARLAAGPRGARAELPRCSKHGRYEPLLGPTARPPAGDAGPAAAAATASSPAGTGTGAPAVAAGPAATHTPAPGAVAAPRPGRSAAAAVAGGEAAPVGARWAVAGEPAAWWRLGWAQALSLAPWRAAVLAGMLGALEAEPGRRPIEEILGARPVVWRGLWAPGHGWLACLPVHDGKMMASMLAAVGAQLAGMLGDLDVQLGARGPAHTLAWGEQGAGRGGGRGFAWEGDRRSIWTSAAPGGLAAARDQACRLPVAISPRGASRAEPRLRLEVVGGAPRLPVPLAGRSMRLQAEVDAAEDGGQLAAARARLEVNF